MELSRNLIELKEKIEEAKTNKSSNEGKKALLMERLVKDYDCTSVEQGFEKVAAMEKKQIKLRTKINRVTDEIEEKVSEFESAG